MTVTIKEGQIWHALFPRTQPYVRIIQVGDALYNLRWIKIRSTTQLHGAWVFAKRSHDIWCGVERFNGKRGGYELYEDEPQ